LRYCHHARKGAASACNGLDLRRIARQGPMAGDRNAHVDLRLTLPPAAQKIATGKAMDLCGVHYPHRIRVSAPPRYPVIVIVEGEQTPIWLRHIERSLGGASARKKRPASVRRRRAARWECSKSSVQSLPWEMPDTDLDRFRALFNRAAKTAEAPALPLWRRPTASKRQIALMAAIPPAAGSLTCRDDHQAIGQDYP
jgi:hypothetical protein